MSFARENSILHNQNHTAEGVKDYEAKRQHAFDLGAEKNHPGWNREPIHQSRDRANDWERPDYRSQGNPQTSEEETPQRIQPAGLMREIENMSQEALLEKMRPV